MNDREPNTRAAPTGLSPTGLAHLRGLIAGLGQLDSILALPEHPQTANPPLAFGRYRLRARLGAGRFGVVLLADEPALGRQVTVKVPQPAVLTDLDLRERFTREGRAAAVLDHPGIVPVIEAGEVGGLPYLAAGFVDGPTLAAYLAARGGQLPAREAAVLVLGIAQAVHHAHEHGVLHCDLTPGNVLVRTPKEGAPVPVVTDFGLARILTDDPGLTQTFRVAGTPYYMAPEQARGDRRGLTARADVYAIGAILFELLTGNPPFLEASAPEIVSRPWDIAPCPGAVNRTVPHDLRAICQQCLESDPQNRYTSAAALADDLTRYLHGDPVAARRTLWPARVMRWTRRNPLVAALVSLAIVLCIVAAERWAVDLQHESELHFAAAERVEAEARANAAEVAVVLERVRQRRLIRSPGWTHANLADIRGVAPRVGGGLLPAFRTEVAAALGTPDLDQPRTIGEGFTAYAPAFSPDSRTLALASWHPVKPGNWEVRLYEPTTGREIRRLGHSTDPAWEKRFGRTGADGCRAVAFSPDGRWLVVGTRSGWLVRWDLSAADQAPIRWRHAPPAIGGREVARFERVTRLVFGADGRMFSGDGSQVVEWDRDSGWAEVRRSSDDEGLFPIRPAGPALPLTPALSPVEPRPCAVGPDGLLAAYLSSSGRAMLRHRWIGADIARLTMPDQDQTENGTIWDLAFSPDGTLLVTTAEHDGHLKLWETVSGRILSARTLGVGSLRVAFAPDGRTLAVTEEGRTLLFGIPASPVAQVAGLQPCLIADADVTPDGQILATTGPPLAEISVRELGPGDRERVRLRLSDVHPQTGSWRCIGLAPDGRSVAANAAEVLKRWSVAAESRADPGGWPVPAAGNAEMAPLQGTKDIRFTPTGMLWTLEGEQLSGWLPGGERRVNAAVVDATSLAAGDDIVLVGHRDGSVSWYALDGTRIRSERSATVPITALCRSGEMVVVGTASGDVIVRNGDTTLKLAGVHADAVQTAAIGPGGWFATGSVDQTVRLWNSEGRPVLTLPQTRPVRRVYWSADGRFLTILATEERAVRRWDLGALKAELITIGLDPNLP